MRYLIASHNGLGNMILKTPMIKALKDIDSAAEIHFIGTNKSGALDAIRGLEGVSSILEYKYITKLAEKVELFAEINRCHYDYIFNPMTDGAPGWLELAFRISNAKRLVQHCVLPGKTLWLKVRHVIPTKNIDFVQWLPARHEIDLNLDLVQTIWSKPIKRSYKTSVFFKIDYSFREKYTLPKNYICIQMGAAAGNNTPKRWPLLYFEELIVSLHALYPSHGIVAVGDKSEGQIIEKHFGDKYNFLLNLAGKTNINQLCDIINSSLVTITHDSGVMHLANALDAKVVALYGPTDYSRTGPLGKNSLIIRKDLPCSPCMFGLHIESESAIFKTCKSKECMTGITVDEVISHVTKKLLENN